jgi:hypothetical protein
MKKKLFIIAGALVVIGAAAASALYYAYPVQMATYAGLTRNYFISLVAPAGTVTTELNAAYKGTGLLRPRLPPRRHRRAPMPIDRLGSKSDGELSGLPCTCSLTV